jgi:hypothetical protein
MRQHTDRIHSGPGPYSPSPDHSPLSTGHFLRKPVTLALDLDEVPEVSLLGIFFLLAHSTGALLDGFEKTVTV